MILLLHLATHPSLVMATAMLAAIVNGARS